MSWGDCALLTKVSQPPEADLKMRATSLYDLACLSGLYRRDLYVMKTVVSRGVPVATVIGGGYSRDIDKLALRHSIVHRAATQVAVYCKTFIMQTFKMSVNWPLISHDADCVSGLERVRDVKLLDLNSGC